MSPPISVAGNEEWLIAVAKRCEIEGKREQARRLAGDVLDAEPGNGEALNLLGVIALRESQPEQAVDLFVQAVAATPDDGMFQRNLGETYRVIGQTEPAIRHARRAAELLPGDAQAHYLLGVALSFTLDLDEAEAATRRAIAIEPEHGFARFHLATLLLLRGNLPEGFAEYEWRWRHPNAPAMIVNQRTKRWTGGEGEALLLVCDQGFGDVFQFIRYLPQVLERCPATRLTGPAEMEALLDLFPPARGLFLALEEVETFDSHCPVSSLPLVFGTMVETIPAPIPYAEADKSRIKDWRKLLADRLPPKRKRIGLVWAGRPEHANDRNRSIPLTQFERVLRLDGLSFVSLQKGEAAGQLEEFSGRDRILDLGPEIGDFADTAAILANLDLLVTVDTSVAHLAGALGVPVLLLLPFSPDWRWLLERTDSPWYPGLKILRQPSPGDWRLVVRNLVIELALLS